MAYHVALFITCLTDQFYPRVGVAVTKILEHYGCTVSFPAAQTCCGQPFFNNGFQADARELAKRWVEVFEDADNARDGAHGGAYGGAYIVTPSGSCCAMVREHYRELFKGDLAWEKDSAAVAERTYEFVEFLTKVLKVNLSGLKLPERVIATYHFTCHLRSLGMTDEAAVLLRQLGNVEFRPLNKTEQCCGFGGTFAVKYAAISKAMVEDKVSNIARTGAAVTVCNDAGCSMNIEGMCRKQGVASQVKHIAEVIAEALGLEIDRF